MQDWLEMRSTLDSSQEYSGLRLYQSIVSPVELAFDRERKDCEMQLEGARMKQDWVRVSDDDRSHMYSPRSHPRANPSA